MKKPVAIEIDPKPKKQKAKSAPKTDTKAPATFELTKVVEVTETDFQRGPRIRSRYCAAKAINLVEALLGRTRIFGVARLWSRA